MEKHVLLKKLRDALESLKGRVAGRNKDDVEEAIAMVSSFLFFCKRKISTSSLFLPNSQVFIFMLLCAFSYEAGSIVLCIAREVNLGECMLMERL